jgi:predicted DNA-binding antitoxin AbrB/MazE fold protein
MNQVIDAIYENGVFRPLLPIDIKEHEVVAIKVIHLDEWQARFGSIIEKIHKKTTKHSSDEIEEDIVLAVNDVRKTKYGD